MPHIDGTLSNLACRTNVVQVMLTTVWASSTLKLVFMNTVFDQKQEILSCFSTKYPSEQSA